jgi:hypothetical protein
MAALAGGSGARGSGAASGNDAHCLIRDEDAPIAMGLKLPSQERGTFRGGAY